MQSEPYEAYEKSSGKSSSVHHFKPTAIIDVFFLLNNNNSNHSSSKFFSNRENILNELHNPIITIIISRKTKFQV